MATQKEISNIKSRIKSIASTPMFIDKHHAMNLMLRYDSFISSINIDGSLEKQFEKLEKQNFVQFHSAEKSVVYGKFGADFSKVPKGSVAVVPVMGAMMRDTYCTFSDGFISGTRDLEQTVKDLDSNENVDGIVFYLNSPGGEAMGGESLSRVVNNTKTPTVVFFEGMASAAVHAFAGAKEVYASEKQSYWGSIGTYITLMDDEEFWNNEGIKFLEIYAPQSTEKNIEYRDAYKGDNSKMESMLSSMTDDFINNVKKSRPQLKDDGHVFKGKIYSATEALKIGAIDGIKTLDFAIEQARKLARKEKRNNNNSNQNQQVMSDEKKLSFFDKFFGKNATEEDAEQDILKTQQAANELKEQLDKANKQTVEQAEQLAKLQADFKELQDLNQAANTELETLKQLVSSDSEKIKAIGFDNVDALISELEVVKAHNIELGAPVQSATPIDNEQNTTAKGSNKARSYEDIKSELEALKKK